MARPPLHGPSPAIPAAPGSQHRSERGQMLVIFALALIALIGMVGLIIDGGDTFLQRRDQQNVADAAAMAAGYAYVNPPTAESPSAESPSAAAQRVAAANGYLNGQDNTTVTVTINSDSIVVDVTRPHRNYFSGLMGFSSWDVSTTAAVRAGIPNGAYGAMPIIFNEDAFHDPTNRDKNAPKSFDEPGTGSEDVPQGNEQFNWTVFCVANGNPCNANTNLVNDLIDTEGTTRTIWLDDDDIGPLNAGSHTALFDSLADKVNRPFPVAIVDDEGVLVGWAWFHLTGSVGGSTKQISGWFDDQWNEPPFKIGPDHDPAGSAFGGHTVELID